VVGKFADLDLHPDVVSNMGYVFEELIRRFAEQSNETAGEHFTPREVIELMVNLLVAPDAHLIGLPGVTRRVLDPACGTGGMLSSADEHIKKMNPQARVEVYGQELNAESWAICRSDLMIKGQDPDNIAFGNSFGDDGRKL
jgi:type I restriction enzyme M protein